MRNYKSPGVYVVEKDSFGSSIVANETAIPVFMGFTEKALTPEGKELKTINGSSIVKKPVLVRSMLEFESSFGGPDVTGRIYVTKKTDDNGKASYTAENKNSEGTGAYVPGFMHPSVSNYFSNGGGSCYIVSLGSYEDFAPSFAEKITAEMNFIQEAIREAEQATLILPTDLIRFDAANYYNWGTQLINFYPPEKNYFTIMDVIQSDAQSSVYHAKDIELYRAQVNPDSSRSSYAGAYFPYLKSLTPYAFKSDYSNVYVGEELLESIASEEDVQEVKTFLTSNFIHMPPSPFIAGIYCRLDNASGVWTPPANVAPTGITGPVVEINNDEQQSMNVDVSAGKSINAIRSFTGKGTLVWGARTNDGNSQDWRYINVRRLFNAMETDISMALGAYVFKPNVHNTWVEVKTAIESYLYGLFNQGAFAGTSPGTSYQVLIGKGETMTDEDILDGYMRVSVMIAPVRPAEFIILTFSQLVGQ